MWKRKEAKRHLFFRLLKFFWVSRLGEGGIQYILGEAKRDVRFDADGILECFMLCAYVCGGEWVCGVCVCV